MFEIEISETAWNDLKEAAEWYEMQRVGLSENLFLCFEEAIEIIKRNPYFEIRYLDIRIVNTKRFPYQVVYRIEGNKIKILAFFHAHKDPKNWKDKK